MPHLPPITIHHQKTCPRCLSNECSPSRIPNPTLGEVAEDTLSNCRAGQASESVRKALAYIFVVAANAMWRAHWSCPHCRNSFR
jgi:hypothetical protein